MSGPERTACTAFEEEVGELVRGMVSEPARTILLDHAATCEACDQLLADLSTVADRLLHLAPVIEPPLGFETRAVEAMKPSAGVARPALRPAWRVAMAAVVVVAALAGVALGRATTPDGPVSIEAAMLTRSGASGGTAELSARPAPRIVLTMTRWHAGDRQWTCELRHPDGRWVAVGTWSAADVTNGVWAAGIDAELSRASGMRILDESGRVVGTATFRS